MIKKYVNRLLIFQEVAGPPAKKTALASLFDDDDDDDDDDENTNNYMLFPVSQKELIKKEIHHYKSMPQNPMSESPLTFWKSKQDELPYLTSLSVKYLGIQASSVAAERVFSTTGDIVTATRSCLKSENVDSLVFLKKNLDT
ncbi:hypothetical protein SNE40_010672 [Patella caerulea]|uniref:HAT C-terminal dimerisation domain-containing protein n=1 Tax=Patella caerulea TaxID=87958 RepID=A0AAN8K2D5_PATCE